ncbi:MAG: M48 family metalloprotease [Bryobacteraceae bacterium]
MFLVLLPAAVPWCAQAQRLPVSAHVNLYFPQIADGAFEGGRWQTTLTFVNANERDAVANVWIHGSDGRPLELDFGGGPKSVFPIMVPGHGSLSLSSVASDTPVRVGWVRVASTLPLSGSASFRLWLGGQAVQEVTAPPTLPTIDYVSYANRELGVAIANPNLRILNVDVALMRGKENMLGPVRITLPPFGHTAFNVRDKFPAADFGDSVLVISGVDRPQDEFLAWTMNADPSGTFSSLPTGMVTPPISHWDRIWNVYRRVMDAAIRLEVFDAAPELRIRSEKIVNAYAAGGREVGIFIGLSELLGDSDSELAFVVGHELGHIYQQQTGSLDFHSNPEFDADIWGTMLALGAGYDVYASAAALAKLAMATGTAGLTTQFEQQLSSDAHKSFNTRISEVFSMLQLVCSLDEARDACQMYKRVMHPHLPDSAPLGWKDLEGRGYRKPDSLSRTRTRGEAVQSAPPQDRARPQRDHPQRDSLN